MVKDTEAETTRKGGFLFLLTCYTEIKSLECVFPSKNHFFYGVPF